MNPAKPCMLMILDGWGINSGKNGNAIALAKTPNLDHLFATYPHSAIRTCGEAVGLPDGIMGNSEVGHMNLGAGRVVFQNLMRIDRAITDKTIYKNSAILSVVSRIKEKKSALHIMGLVSDGGVHSQLTHLFALLDIAKEADLKNVFIHAILDGRDTPPDSGIKYIEKLESYITKNGVGVIASICGRYYAMDRDTRWDRTKKAFDLYSSGKGIVGTDPVTAVKNAYGRGETDEFVKPVIMCDENAKFHALIDDNDGIVFFNFRADRAKQITRAFTESGFDLFKKEKSPQLCEFVSMTHYDDTFTIPQMFSPVSLEEILGETICKAGKEQLRIAETEKYAHVTYFFNGGQEKEFDYEDRCLIPSPRDVATYDLKPEMSANEVAAEAVARVESGKYDFIVLNFANMDMVGHTGIVDAAVTACETVDNCVGQVVEAVLAKGGIVLITADHGNAEEMISKSGGAHTAHTLNDVPLIFVDESNKEVMLKGGSLCDIAPTVLKIMGLEQPEEMTGVSLF